jgi:CRISPR-associated endoribonuclease Cas6
MTKPPDLLSLVLQLRPLPAPELEKTAPRWWGRAAHTLLLQILQDQDPQLAGELHDAEGLKPFTASTLMGAFPNRRLDPEKEYTLRFTTAQTGVAVRLLEAIQPDGPLSSGAQVELDYHPFAITQAFTNDSQHPWAGQTHFQNLGADYILAGSQPPRQLSLHFASPTTFKSGGRHQPVPLPGLVFGSLLEKWNAFAPITFPPEVRRFAEECLNISRFRLNSAVVPLKEGGLRIGAVGQVTYTTSNYDRYWMSLVTALAMFAQFAGVGAGVSYGLGQCRQAIPQAER